MYNIESIVNLLFPVWGSQKHDEGSSLFFLNAPWENTL